MRRALCVAIFLASSTFVALAAAGEPWVMVGKDEAHSNSISEGPSPPLREAWVAKSGDPESSFTTWPTAKDGIVYARVGPSVLAISAPDGRRIWFWQSPEGQKQISPSIGEDTLYVPLPFARVVALNLVDATEIWRVDLGEGGTADPSMTLSAGRIFFGLPDDLAVLSLSAEDGRELWRTSTELLPNSVPAVADGIVVLSTEHVGSRRVLVLALDAETGGEIWRAEQKEGNSSPSILGNKVILGGGDFFAYALDLKTGKEIWKSPVEDKFSVRNMPALAFGDVFLADRIGNIYRLDGETGKRKWIFRDTEGTMDQSFPVIAGKTLFIGSGAGNLYALDTDTGRLLWKDHVDGIVLSGAADSERFYFGVKLGKDEGLHAYEHDPEGKLEPAPSRFRDVQPLVGGLILFALVFVGVILYTRRRRGRESELNAP